jgi:hypothetical protein
MSDAASQEPGPQLQSAHIARRRALSGDVNVRVAFTHPNRPFQSKSSRVHPPQSPFPIEILESLTLRVLSLYMPRVC